ncbi:hypothetical protein L598_001300000100 [Mesorhizobium sp. J18]|nr:hypothetical protein L598_001300000100 [Mesorhizobium sp. J18]
MKTFAALLALTIAAAVLSGCGGSPMSVESRTGASRELTLEDKMKIKRQIVRSRASGR